MVHCLHEGRVRNVHTLRFKNWTSCNIPTLTPQNITLSANARVRTDPHVCHRDYALSDMQHAISNLDLTSS